MLLRGLTCVNLSISFERPVSEAPGPAVPHGGDDGGGGRTEQQPVEQHCHAAVLV